MVLRSLFLGMDEEVDWAFRKGPLIFKPNLIVELNNILGNKYDQNPKASNLYPFTELPGNLPGHVRMNLWSD